MKDRRLLKLLACFIWASILAWPLVLLAATNPPKDAFLVEYYDNRDLVGIPVLVTTEPDINHNWEAGSPDERIPVDKFSARWTGLFPFYQGNYVFTVTSDDGVRVWLDNDLIVDEWQSQPPTTFTSEVAVSEGDHTIRVEYFESYGDAEISVNWRLDGTPPPQEGDSDVTVITVKPDVLVSGVKHFGINIGARDRYGAAQILKNFIDDPGFEAGQYATIFHVDENASADRVPIAFWKTTWNNDDLGIGQPEGFWNGGEYEFVYGTRKGERGTILNFTHENDQYVLYPEFNGPVPDTWDVFITRKFMNGVFVDGDGFDADPTTVRPGSTGHQSLHLWYPGASWKAAYIYFMDSFWRDGDRSAGKLLIVKGDWHLDFWAKGNKDGDRVRVRFYRENEKTFIDKTYSLTTQWQHIVEDFNVPEGDDPVRSYSEDEYHPILAFAFYVPASGEEVWVDDVTLCPRAETNPTVFTDRFVSLLKELQPGILRDWSNQLGSSLDNQLADPMARQTQGWQPQKRTPRYFSYSLHEFLELCEEVGSEPWYVIPPTFAPEDFLNLVAYLAAPVESGHPYAQLRSALGHPAPWTETFSMIHLEFGNEMWGSASGSDPFWGASALGGVRLGAIANDRFALIKSSPYFNPARFDLIIGGQAAAPSTQADIEANSHNHDTIALAPYFGVLDSYQNDDEMYLPLFAQALSRARDGDIKQSADILAQSGQGTNLSVYEINFHTTDGPAPTDIRNDFVTGADGALALPLHMLTYLKELGIRNQAAFAATQFSFRMDNGEYVRLWGMLRDLEATSRKRPTWLGLELVNKAIEGDLLATEQTGANPCWYQPAINGVFQPIHVPYVQSFAFRDGSRYSLVLFNLNLTDPEMVRLDLPTVPTSSATGYTISPASLHDDNEDQDQVTIQDLSLPNFANGYEMSLPPHSVSVILWESNEAPPQPVPSQFNLGAAAYEISEGGTAVQIPVIRNGGSDGEASVMVTTSDDTASYGSDYSKLVMRLSWTDGDSQDKFIRIPIADDIDTEGDETFFVNLSDPQGNAELGTVTTAQITIKDDDSQGCEEIPVGAFCAAYFDNEYLQGSPVLEQTESKIDHYWGTHAPAEDLPADYFSVRWQGWFDFDNKSYEFKVTTDDGMRLWVDDTLVIDAWKLQASTTYRKKVQLSAGQHLIKVEYFEHNGYAVAKARWR